MDERPLECSECRKPNPIHFIQISMTGQTEMSVCSDCPLIAGLLDENPSSYRPFSAGQSHGICCGNCSTTMDAVQMGSPLGCASCYEVFADVICTQILKVPISQAIHCGRSLGESSGISPTLRLYALNEALQETLHREEYEEAARIRDEINALMESKTTKAELSSQEALGSTDDLPPTPGPS